MRLKFRARPDVASTSRNIRSSPAKSARVIDVSYAKAGGKRLIERGATRVARSFQRDGTSGGRSSDVTERRKEEESLSLSLSLSRARARLCARKQPNQRKSKARRNGDFYILEARCELASERERERECAHPTRNRAA